MTSFASRWRVGLALALAVLAAACSNAPRPNVSAGSTVRSIPGGEIEAIATMLDQGQRAEAKKRIAAALKHDPLNPNLMLLRDSLDRDPQELLGPQHYPYIVQPGDTIAGLAQRFLGNRLKSYQLARYNGIKGPATLSAGQVLQIPGQPPRAEPARVERRPAEPPAAPHPKAVPAPRPALAPPANRPTVNPAAARQARAAGLAALNEGNPGRAVSLLSRAAALDPGNPVIARDLQRAQRINATVKARQ
jgi:hypothetical protein